MRKNDPSPEPPPDDEPPVFAANLRGDDTPDQTGAVRTIFHLFCGPNCEHD
jgi:hypothetical protein